MNATILKLSDKRAALKKRIASRKKSHRGHADLDVQLLAATMRQLRAERRVLRPISMSQLCEGCGINRFDPPSKLCPGCQAYQEHQS